MANDFDDDLLQDESTPPPVKPEAPVEGTPPPPKHSPLALAMARELGIDTEDQTPESLQAAITAVRRHTAPKPAAPEPEADEPVDWGRNADGTPRTEQQFLEAFDPEIAHNRKIAHQAVVENKKLRKQYETLQQQLQREQAERNNRAVEKKLRTILSERPDLFGDKPGTAKPGTPEHQRYQLVAAHLSGLVTAKQHTTLEDDARAAMELFGPSQEQPKAKGPPTREAYRQAELARPSQRRHADNRTAKEKRVEQVAAEMAEQNGYLESGDDDADLLD